jgi:hypothetical protein
MTVERQKVVPVWVLGLLVALGSTGLALTADRASIASLTGNLEARVVVLEKQAEETRTMHLEILRELAGIESRQEQIGERLDEVRRKLKIIQ